MTRNTTFGELKDDLVYMRLNKDLYDMEGFIKKYETLGLSHVSLETLWRVTNIGYCSYEFSMPDFTRLDIQNFQAAGFIVDIRTNTKFAGQQKTLKKYRMINSKEAEPIIVCRSVREIAFG